MERQDYSNHKQYIPMFHFVMFGLIICALIGSVKIYIDSMNRDDNFYASAIILILSVIQLIGFFYFRGFSLRAEERAIRSEENFRHYALSGKPLDTRLTMKQITALRFAPDDELVLLAREAVEKQMTSEEIKKSIKRWKGDYNRV